MDTHLVYFIGGFEHRGLNSEGSNLGLVLWKIELMWFERVSSNCPLPIMHLVKQVSPRYQSCLVPPLALTSFLLCSPISGGPLNPVGPCWAC